MKKTSRVRIISGHYKGRYVAFQPGVGLRPTGSRLRETLFNWLQQDIVGSRCLDLFAGSGVLGFEAISRGAERVVSVDANLAAVKKIQQQCLQWGVTGLTAYHAHFPKLPKAISQQAFDIIFVDPPFHQSLVEQALHWIKQHLRQSSPQLIYLEHEKNLVVPPLFPLLKRCSSGASVAALLCASSSMPMASSCDK